ncbi:hypothetical protein HG264_05550 [Pseudomonas sp. gcc21]|uniref:GTPase n=1 Tax=Pseudomonas sp. gcc21 TaxID=2726989 RepID=UPI0014527B08|nr:GTPase [Pseudomonas sp. gcc21]QJD58410.1 hypothetical protein HG264_05550 [Pseudomonas sp. gcc21]
MKQEEALQAEFDKQVNDVAKVNLMLVGGTGVGKSSLINRVLGEEVAKVGSGRPVTKGCERFEKENLPVVVYDSEGYEIVDGEVNNDNFRSVVIAEVDRLAKLSLKDQIHLFWYCISVNSHRVTEYDVVNLKDLAGRNVNLAVVLTQCDGDELDENNQGVVAAAFKRELRNAGIDSPVFETSTTLEEDLELSSLIEWSAESLPAEKLKDAFVGAQVSNIPMKEKQATQAVLMAAAAAGGAAGLNPIPMSDSVALLPIQLALAARLANIYGFSTLDAGAIVLLKSQILSLLGRQMAASLTKLIPIFGQVINAGVASAITAGFGYSLSAIYKSAYVTLLETGKVPDWASLFKYMDLVGMITKEQGKQNL